MPGAPSSSWSQTAARLRTMAQHTDARVALAFWLLGLVNNVIYVIVLSAAQDLVGSAPKGLVLLADVMPSLLLKTLAPYAVQRIPYAARVLLCVALSAAGMVLVAAAGSLSVKVLGVALASVSSGGGELSFLGLTHYYGHVALAGWGSGTGAAGLIGAGLYVVLRDWWGFSVRASLLFSACLPVMMLVSFFGVLPRKALRRGDVQPPSYERVPGRESEDVPPHAASALLEPVPSVSEAARARSIGENMRRTRQLVVPYMVPLFLVYLAEYTINQGVAPTLLFPLEQSPFAEYREFYPFYGFLYQLGVFISRSSIAVFRVHDLYSPALLQVGNLAFLTAHATLFFLPSVYVVFAVVFWEGLLGGATYVNCFAEMMEQVPAEEREFSLGAVSVADSAGICLAGVVGILLEPALCGYQVAQGRNWCRQAGQGAG
ncbi:BTN1-like protein [Stachybotrys elegans]|uniref:Protein BTN n=1 Tax=Stachybotrys elegans TaxID=80388 RepID=A0A8K0SC12_9HYPO|nr:BTN1-like protein [Stachybotrys elegans]